MNTNNRNTRECSMDSLRPEIAVAIRKHAELHNLENVESDISACCETISTQKKTGLFGGSETIITGALLTPEWLILSTKTGNEKPDVISARLKNIQAQNFESTPMYRVNPDSGLNITGRYSDVTKQGMTFLGLESEPAAEKFRQALQQALKTANPQF